MSENRNIDGKELEMSPLKFLRRHWHDLGLISAAIAGAWLTLNWDQVFFYKDFFFSILLSFFCINLKNTAGRVDFQRSRIWLCSQVRSQTAIH